MRLFVAVRVEEPHVLDALVAVRGLVERTARVKWAEREQLHLTLRFLGEVDAARVDALRGALADAVRGVEPFRLVLAGLGVFPPRGAPRVVWAGVSFGAERLAELTARVEERLAEAGFPREARRFSPHVTLGRVREGESGRASLAALARVAARPFGSVEVLDAVLLQSVLGSAGATHTELLRVGLGGGDARGRDWI